MALTDESSGIPATMLVSPTGGGMPYPVYQGGNGGGFGGENGGWWIVLLIIVIAALGGNWGGNNNGGFGGGQPIIVNDGGGSSVQRGFDQAAVMSGIYGVQSGVNALSAQLCNCCGDMQMSLSNGVNAIQAQMYQNQLSALERSFAAQTASTQGMTNLSSQFADCCCENRLATERLNATIARENCADREALNYAARDIINSQTAGTQRILDQLCADKIDAKNEKIADLERQLTMANLSASQIAQTAQIQRGQVAEVDALYQRLRDCPVPSMPVAGMAPLFQCNPSFANQGCGCGCGGNNF